MLRNDGRLKSLEVRVTWGHGVIGNPLAVFYAFCVFVRRGGSFLRGSGWAFFSVSALSGVLWLVASCARLAVESSGSDVFSFMKQFSLVRDFRERGGSMRGCAAVSGKSSRREDFYLDELVIRRAATNAPARL